MDLQLFLNSVILLGALQGFIIGSVLLFSSKQNESTRILSWVVLIIALATLKVYLGNIQALESQAGAFIDALIPFFIIMPVGPLIYFYCRTHLQPGFERNSIHRWHFYPVIIDVFHHLSALVFIILVLAGLVDPQQSNFGYWFDQYNVYADIPRWLSLTVYLFFSVRMLRSQFLPVSSRWIKEFLIIFIAFDVLWLVYLVPYVIPAYTDVILNTLGWYPIYIPLVVIVYWLGIRGLQISLRNLNIVKKSNTVQLADKIADALMAQIRTSMISEKLFMDPNLNVARLAEHVGTSPKIVSAVLNQKAGKGFNAYVNEFRIEEVKRRLLLPETKKYTIASLAYDCGFNSQPTFQRAFKDHVGITPREFLQQQPNAV